MATAAPANAVMSRRASIATIDVRGKRVLMRVDFNVPLDDHSPRRISDDRRIRMALPTIRSVIDRGGRLVLMSHLGRPEGRGVEPSESLRPAADRLRELLGGVSVTFPSDDCVNPASKAAVDALKPGDIVVLENLRFHKGEKTGDPAFAARLAAYGDIYCNDAFGTAHRPDASMVAVPKAMAGKPRVAGLLLQKELQYLAEAIHNAGHPFTALLGGAKVSDKLSAIRNLMGRVDTILVGGAMAYTFLKALGQGVGSSLVQNGMLDEARRILEEAAASRTELILPQDHVCGRQITRMTPVQVVKESIPDGWMGLDIGPETTARYSDILDDSKTVVWNGPVGAFETPPFDVGTRQVARGIAKATAKGGITIVGGGDTAAAVEAFGMAEQFSHVSTGGGASLEMLEGKAFESVMVLDPA
jgi:phosphoglycerate kinase